MNNGTYLLENRHFHPIDSLYHRDGSQLGVASCDFVSTTPAKADVAPKVSLACWGRGKIGRNSQFYHLKIKQHERRKNHHL